MKLTDQEKRILDGKEGLIKAQALDYLVQFGDAFGAENLLNVSYCHYPAEMGIYDGFCEDVEKYSNSNIKVAVPTTSSTLCCDLEYPSITDCPIDLVTKQRKTETAFRKMGILETFTCTPQQIGFVPLFGSHIVSVESSAIIYFNSILGARTNRGGLFTRYSSITGKYPAMGYMLDENREPNCYYDINIPMSMLQTMDQWSILGYIIGKTAGGKVPLIFGINSPPTTSQAITFGAAMATSGSVTLFHIAGVTPEIQSMNHGKAKDYRNLDSFHEIGIKDIEEAYLDFNMIEKHSKVDIVVLGCPHANLEDIRYYSEKLQGKRIAANTMLWICTNRMTRMQAKYSGYISIIEKAGAKVIADTCPVESHMRKTICETYNISYPCFPRMVSNSVKMLRYSRELLGVQTAIASTDKCIYSAISGTLQ
ncbi:MAG: aconitase X catalytic domain-containing protein [Caldisericia bacterium]|nr:aconitase X catalytic domain-containing protein [Caldisericia bacterium]